MNFRNLRGTRLGLILLLAASAVTAIATVIVLPGRMRSSPEPSSQVSRFVSLAAAAEPIHAEAEVFRTRPEMLAVDPMPGDRRSAHPRTLKTYRSLRAYPGAPPRIPHGLTPIETLKGGCNTCHEQGGYSQRFGAYVPITPHPDMGACLQCHVGDANLMSTPLPGMDPSARCRQCHAAGAMLWQETSTNWKPISWPEIAELSGQHAPPPIPHGLELRGNCLSCHSAPAGVQEIRTSHPERANCRQCHVESRGPAEDFIRPRLRAERHDGGAR